MVTAGTTDAHNPTRWSNPGDRHIGKRLREPRRLRTRRVLSHRLRVCCVSRRTKRPRRSFPRRGRFVLLTDTSGLAPGNPTTSSHPLRGVTLFRPLRGLLHDSYTVSTRPCAVLVCPQSGRRPVTPQSGCDEVIEV